MSEVPDSDPPDSFQTIPTSIPPGAPPWLAHFLGRLESLIETNAAAVETNSDLARSILTLTASYKRFYNEVSRWRHSIGKRIDEIALAQRRLQLEWDDFKANNPELIRDRPTLRPSAILSEPAFAPLPPFHEPEDESEPPSEDDE